MRRELTAFVASAVIAAGLAAAAPAAQAAPAPAGAARVVVTDPVDARAHLDLRRVVYRVGEKMAGVTATVRTLPPAGVLVVRATNPGSADSLDLVLERSPRGSVLAYAEYNFLEDAGGPIRCHTTHQWNRRTDVVSIAVSRACVTRFARSVGRTFRFDRLEMEASTGTRDFYRMDTSGPVQLDS